MRMSVVRVSGLVYSQRVVESCIVVPGLRLAEYE